MKLTFLLLLALLALSSASLLDIVKQSSQHRNVSLLKPDLQDRVPETAANMSVPTHQSPPSPAKLRQKRQTQFHGYGKLKWKTWTGSLPYGAVSIYNKYAGRTDYICKNGCDSGFYNPGKGSYCHNPFKGKEYHSSQFEILVNEDNFEILRWKKASRGSVPSYSIRTCTRDELYVGKHWYGLGKVHPAHNCFYLPWEGKEYWYRDYEVLTIKRDVEREQVSNVRYNINGGDTVTYPPQTILNSVITNHECNFVSKKTELSTKSKVERKWDINTSFFFGVTATLNAGLPDIASGSIGASAQMTLQVSRGQTHSEETSHSVSVDLRIPPNHQCRVRMVGRKYKKNIPFTAQLTRTYRTGETISTQISGMYNGVGVGDVKSMIDRCEPVAYPLPCSSKSL